MRPGHDLTITALVCCDADCLSTLSGSLTRDVDIDYQPNRYREDADLDGFLAADSITIGGVRSANQSFGVVTNVRELETLPATNAGVLGMGLGVGDDTGSVAWWEAARLDWSSASFGIRLQRFAISNATTGSWPSQALQGGGHLDLYGSASATSNTLRCS